MKHKKQWIKPLVIKLNPTIESGGHGYPYPEYLKRCNNGSITTIDHYLNATASVVSAHVFASTVDALNDDSIVS